MYIHAPAGLDASAAPPGEDSLTAIVPVGHLRSDGAQDWNENRDRAREHVFRRLRTLGIADVRDHIKFEEAYTPVTWAQRHNLAKGATHGLSHTLTQMGYLQATQPAPPLPKPVLRRGEHASRDGGSDGDGLRPPRSEADRRGAPMTPERPRSLNLNRDGGRPGG